MLDKFKESVKDFSSGVKSKVAEKELGEDDLEPLLDDLRLQLLQNNVSLDAVEEIEESLRDRLLGEKVTREKVDEKVDGAVKDALLEILDDDFDLDAALESADEPPVVFLIGFNGSGKTTTAAKLAHLLDGDVVLGAGDTFRAASIEQLKEHGESLGVEVVAHEYESDPAAVAYDTVENAGKEGRVAIVDTAGRSHSDQNLMDELEKMVRVNEPDITFLVVDALAGNDVVEQVKAYEGMFDAVVMTKMDVDEKGGAIVSVAKETDRPVAFIGTGQGYEDLEKFDKEEFVTKILD
ncbi:MAG: signal recognition particle receptor subunit alpha [Candidatus Nanohaloarchaea archaeon]